VVAHSTPAIQPVDVGGGTGHAAPTNDDRNQVKRIVLRKNLRRRIANCSPAQPLCHAGDWNETLRLVSHARAEFINYAAAKEVYPVKRSGHPVVLVKVVREDAPTIGVASGPTGRPQSQIV